MMGLIFRLLLKAMVPLTIVFGAMSYVMYLNGQNPISVFDGFGDRILAIFSDAGESVGKLPEKVGSAIEGDSRTFYKWQDAGGSWHYGEDPPANAQSLTAITLRLTDNVVPAFKDPSAVAAEVEEENNDDAEKEKPAKKEKEGGGLNLESPYSPDQIKQLFEDTRQLQETINTRQQQLNEVVGAPSSDRWIGVKRP